MGEYNIERIGFDCPCARYDDARRQHRRDVVALRGAARELAHVHEQRVEEPLRLDLDVLLDAAENPSLAVLLALGRERLRDAVAEDDEPVAL